MIITLGSVPHGSQTFMYKVINGFILANGFEGKEGELLTDSTFTKSEIASLVKDGSIKADKPGAKASKPAPKKPAKKTKKSK